MLHDFEDGGQEREFADILCLKPRFNEDEDLEIKSICMNIENEYRK